MAQDGLEFVIRPSVRLHSRVSQDYMNKLIFYYILAALGFWRLRWGWQVNEEIIGMQLEKTWDWEL